MKSPYKVLFGVFIFSIMMSMVLAAECPYGIEDEPYPGTCVRYIDDNADGYCDLSQDEEDLKPEIVAKETTDTASDEDLISGKDLKEKTVSEVAEIYRIDAERYADALTEYLGATVKENDEFQILHDNYGIEPSAAKDIALGIQTGKEVRLEAKTRTKVYHLIEITLGLVLVYALTFFLVRIGKMNIALQRRIWNTALLITFLGSGLLGILLVFRINSGISIPLPFNILFWHVEIGIAMAIISFIHIAWHLNYYKRIFT